MRHAAHIPPRPHLALRVGVTGHRLRRLLELGCDVSCTTAHVGAALTEIQRAAADVARWDADLYASDTPLLHVVSPLAEGADQIVADAAVALGFALDVILPFDREEYAARFDVALTCGGENPRAAFERLITHERVVSIRQLCGATDDAALPEAYFAAGMAVLRHSDILIAVWDGAPARGRGGTAEMVEHARALGTPVVWINPTAPGGSTLLLPEGDNNAGRSAESLSATVRSLLALPTVSASSDDGESPQDALRAYLACTPKRRSPRLFDMLARIAAGESPIGTGPDMDGDSLLERAVQTCGAEWRKPPALPDALQHRLRQRVLPYYAWADGLAMQHGARYRSAFALMYLLAPLAVVAALFGELGPRIIGRNGSLWGWVAVVEVALLTAILVSYAAARRGAYHQRWIDCRSLAEQLRHLLFLWPVGRPTTEERASQGGAADGTTLSWTAWYCRAVAREIGVCPGVVDGAFLETMRALLLDRILAGQIEYHRRNGERMHRVHRRLHHTATWLFVAAAAIAIAHVGTLLPEGAFTQPLLRRADGVADAGGLGAVEVLVGAVAVLLPMLAASVHGFLSQGDFWNIGRRSAHMHERLAALRESLADRPVTVEDLGWAAEDAAAALRDEVLMWRTFVRLKPITLV